MSTKTEREKMLAGELYVAADAELFAMMQRGRSFMQRFNQSPYDRPDEKRAILAEWLGAAGNPCRVIRELPAEPGETSGF